MTAISFSERDIETLKTTIEKNSVLRYIPNRKWSHFSSPKDSFSNSFLRSSSENKWRIYVIKWIFSNMRQRCFKSLFSWQCL